MPDPDWKQVALWMADVHAANFNDVEQVSCSKRKKARYLSIMNTCLELLMAQRNTRYKEDFDTVVNRLKRNSEVLRKQLEK